MHNSKRLLNVYTIIKPEIEKLKKIGNTTPSLDCRILLSHVMGFSETIYSHENINISAEEITLFKKLIKDRYMGKPISRIISQKNFWKNTFKINENTLDPRPDSETIIEAILKHIPDKSKSCKILDLGSGSGCLGLSLINEYENSKVTFLDISKKSLQAVKANALKFDLYEKSKFVNLDWRNSDWQKNLLKLEKNIKFDLIVSNPPYIASNDIKNLQIEVKEYEPIIALDGGKDGLDAFRFIMPKINNLLKENGKIFIEIGKGQQNQVENSTRIKVVIPGHSYIMVGDVVRFQLPSKEPNKGEKVLYGYDEYHSGRYLISKLRHRLIRGEYKIVLELVKDSVMRNYENLRDQSYEVQEREDGSSKDIYELDDRLVSQRMGHHG